MTNATLNALITAVEQVDDTVLRGFAIDLVRYHHLKCEEVIILFSYMLRNPGMISHAQHVKRLHEAAEIVAPRTNVAAQNN